MVDSVLQGPSPAYEFAKGAWGPPQAEAVTPPTEWHNPAATAEKLLSAALSYLNQALRIDYDPPHPEIRPIF